MRNIIEARTKALLKFIKNNNLESVFENDVDFLKDVTSRVSFTETMFTLDELSNFVREKENLATYYSVGYSYAVKVIRMAEVIFEVSHLLKGSTVKNFFDIIANYRPNYCCLWEIVSNNVVELIRIVTENDCWNSEGVYGMIRPIYLEALRKKELKKKGKPIHNYSYPLQFTYKGIGDKYLGIEWELNGGGRDEDKFNDIFIDDDKDLWHFKVDGSINEGYEAISNPMTIDIALSTPWQKFMRKAKNYGYTKEVGAGVHIHVNRSLFPSQHQKKYIVRLIRFFYRNFNDIVKFANRDERDLHWCKKQIICRNESINEIYSSSRFDSRICKYYAVNTLHDKTIEFRIFRSTTDKKVMLSYIQFVDTLTDLVLSDSRAIYSWTKFKELATTKGYKELLSRLQECGV